MGKGMGAAISKTWCIHFRVDRVFAVHLLHPAMRQVDIVDVGHPGGFNLACFSVA